MDINKTFNALVKVCDSLNKITSEKIIVSNGVFLWRIEGSMAITTFHQKIEKDMMELLSGKYVLNVTGILFMSRYFQIEDIQLTDGGIEFYFSGNVSAAALEDKNVESVLMTIEKVENGNYRLVMEWIPDDYLEFIQLSGILRKIDETADFSKSVMIEGLDKTALMKGDKPLEIDQDGFNIRIAKSLFQSINTADTISFRCTPYLAADSIFLCTATVSKDHCQVINVFNALRI